MKIEASSVSETTKRDAGVLESCVQRKFTPAPLWTEAMLAALQRGVKGGKWHSLIDKVWHPDTLMVSTSATPFDDASVGGAGFGRT
jgi:RNA-directed DNA polymerase